MGWTTGRTPLQTVNALVAAGALFDQAANVVYGLAHQKNKPSIQWGVLVQCTTGWNDGAPLFQYDTAPAAGSTNQTVAQAVTTLVAAGATSDQATQVLHSLAWSPGQTAIMWGVQVKCTSGWNSSNALYSVNNAPS